MARRPRLTIPRRVFLAFALLLVVSGTALMASFIQHQRTAATLSLVHEGYLPLALTVSEARATQSVFGNLLDRVLSERNSATTRAWLASARRSRPGTLDRAIEVIAKIERLAPPANDRTSLAKQRRELRRVKTMLSKGEARYEELFAAIDSADKEGAERILADLRARERAIDGRLRTVWASVLRRIEETSERAAVEQDRALAVLAGLVAFALLVGVAVTWWSQRVLSPLPRLQERVEAVARGDLAHRLGPNTDDEIGRLGREFEGMVEALSARDRSLKSLQQMQAQILSDLRAAVLVVDGDAILRSQNPAAQALFELGPAALGSPVREVGLDARIEGLAAAIDEVAAGAPRAVLNEVALAPVVQQADDAGYAMQDRPSHESVSEPRRQLNVVVTPFGMRPEVDAPNARSGVLIVAEDVTEELQTKVRLIQSERLAAIGRMAAHVTHEVRNPLSSIGLNVELLEEELAGAGDEARELVAAIHREIEHLTAVTEEYLRVARLPNPQLEPEYLGDIVQSMAEFMRPELSAASIDLTLDVDEDLPLVALDETQIRQVLINLLKNAREAMPQGGPVRVEVHQLGASLGGGVIVRVADHGEGMTADQRARIFDLFYTTKKTGSGLGLPLSQQIVVAHGGVIRCQSAPNEGTTFELWFPAHGSDAAVA